MKDKITEKLTALEAMAMPELKAAWRSYFYNDPVRFQRDYMIRRIAYQIQASAYGGLPKTIRNKLQRMAEQGQEKVCEQYRLTTGTRLMREYKG
jgi:hypothetical protein